MITLTLLHPTESVPVQSWSFEPVPVIRIGRSKENDVVVYSAVVSRHHVEIWNNPSGWEVINFGSNGTFVDDKPITQIPVADGMVIRLGGSSGPKIRIRIGAIDPKAMIKTATVKQASTSNPTNQISEKQTFLRRREHKPEEGTQTDFD